MDDPATQSAIQIAGLRIAELGPNGFGERVVGRLIKPTDRLRLFDSVPRVTAAPLNGQATARRKSFDFFEDALGKSGSRRWRHCDIIAWVVFGQKTRVSQAVLARLLSAVQLFGAERMLSGVSAAAAQALAARGGDFSHTRTLSRVESAWAVCFEQFKNRNSPK